MKKIKIAIVMPIWQRPKVLKAVLKQLEKFTKFNEKYFDFHLVAVTSIEDPRNYNISQTLLEYKGSLEHVSHNNEFVSNKTNAGFDAVVNKEFHYYMNIGSDDLLHPFLMTFYMPYIKSKTDFFGINSLYITDFLTHKTVFYKSYNMPYVIGAGRMISKKALQTVYKKFGGLYPPKIQRVLDTKSANRLMECGFSSTYIDSGQFPFCVDLKSDVNINDFNKFKKNKRINSVESNIVLNSFNSQLWTK